MPKTFLIHLRCSPGVQRGRLASACVTREEIAENDFNLNNPRYVDTFEAESQTGYFPKTIQMSLGEMAYSGKIHPVPKGREEHYRVDAAEWALLRPQDGAGPGWVAWPQFFAAMTGIRRLVQNPQLAKASPALQAAEWQKVMGQVQPLLAQSDPSVILKDLNRLTGTAYLQAVQQEVLRLFSPEAR